VSPRGVGALLSASLRRGSARIPVQRNHFGLGFTRHDPLPSPTLALLVV
jgi:hypothetical protein